MPWPNQKQNQSWGTEKEEYDVDPATYADYLIKQIITSLSDAIQSGKTMEQGYTLYAVNVDMLELLCRANKWLGDDYENNVINKITELGLKKEDYERDPRTTLRIAKVKFSILLNEIFSSRMKDEELSM